MCLHLTPLGVYVPAHRGAHTWPLRGLCACTWHPRGQKIPMHSLFQNFAHTLPTGADIMMALSMAPFFIRPRWFKGVQHDLFGHVMPVLAYHDTWWHHQWHHCISIIKIIKMECNITLLVMWCIWWWHWHHVILMALSIAQLHLLAQDDQNKVQHDYFGDDMSSAPVLTSYHANGIVNGTTVFIRSRQSKWGATWCLGHVMPLVLGLTSYDSTCIINSTIVPWGQGNQNKVQHYFLAYDSIDISIGITYCHIHSCQHEMMHTALLMASLNYLGQDNWKEVQHDFFGHITPLALLSATCGTGIGIT